MTSFFVDLLDIGLNVSMMIVTGSIVLLAEAFEGASDLVASGLLFIGLRISKKRPDSRHPFGFGEALFTWTLMSAMVMLIFGGGLSFYFGLKRFLDPHELTNIGLAYGALSFSILSNGYAMSLSARRLLKKRPLKEFFTIFRHTTLVETKNTFILDLTGTSAAVVGLCALITYQLTNYQQLDGIGGMLMGLVIASSSIVLVWGIKDLLAGKGADYELVQKIKKIVLDTEGVKSVLDLKSLYLGSEKLLLHLDIQPLHDISIKESEKLVEDIKNNIKKAEKNVREIQIEVRAPS